MDAAFGDFKEGHKCHQLEVEFNLGPKGLSHDAVRTSHFTSTVVGSLVAMNTRTRGIKDYAFDGEKGMSRKGGSFDWNAEEHSTSYCTR